MRQLEGGWYSADRITKSKQRVDRLGYFNEVNIETPSVSGATDQVDVNMSVVEKPTGNIMIGAGYGSSEGVILSGGVSQNNVFGTGNFVGIQLNTSKVNTIYSFSFTQPYWTVDGVSRGFDIYKRNFNPTSIGAGLYNTKTLGGAGRIGIPFTDIDNISLGLGYEETNLTTYSDSPDRILSYVATFGNINTSIPATIGWVRDTRDSAIYTTRGGTQRGSLEVGIPGGTLQYYKLGYQNQRYYPLNSTVTLYLNGDIAIGGGLDDKPLPFFKNYYLGGVSTVRGFTTATIGPKYSDGTPIGGSKKIMGNAEFLFPFPGMANEKSVRLGAFLDTGMVGEEFKAADLRASVGVGLTWVSPFGPIKISMANAIRSQSSDGKQKFQFTFGQMF
jgi:outer membrane protein insertion porin family